MIIAQLLWMDDNDSYMLGEDTRRPANPGPFYDWRFFLGDSLHPACCKTCGRKIDPDYVSPTFRVKKRRLDVGATYDGYVIVSLRFRDYCRSLKLPGVAFITLPADEQFFCLRVRKVLAYDLQRGKPERTNKCPRCKMFHDVVGGIDAFRGIKAPIATGIYRSDLEFGSGHEQGPLLVGGIQTVQELKRKKFKGLDFEDLER